MCLVRQGSLVCPVSLQINGESQVPLKIYKAISILTYFILYPAYMWSTDISRWCQSNLFKWGVCLIHREHRKQENFGWLHLLSLSYQLYFDDRCPIKPQNGGAGSKCHSIKNVWKKWMTDCFQPDQSWGHAWRGASVNILPKGSLDTISWCLSHKNGKNYWKNSSSVY